jgi:hypothetical protein
MIGSNDLRVQRLGPNAGGGADRGTGRCWSREVGVVRVVAGMASWVAGSWVGVGGSWSRMRHQRAAAGDRRVGVLRRPPPNEEGGVEAGPGEVGQPLLEIGQEWVCGGAGGFCGEQPPPSLICVGVRESCVESLLGDSGGVAELGWPGGSQVGGVDLGCSAPNLYIGHQLGRHESA